MKAKQNIVKELRSLRALGAEIIERTSRLEEELAPVQAPAPRKGRRDPVKEAVERRNKRIFKA